MSRAQLTPERILSGRRERDLLAYPSVERMARLVVERCREPSWVRLLVASLERFRVLTAQPDLEQLLRTARQEPAIAGAALRRLADRLARHAPAQIAALALGPKVWFRLNGVVVPWRTLPGGVPPPIAGINEDADRASRAVLLALIGSGLHRAELLRLRIGDVGSLDTDGRLVPDLASDSLAIRYTARCGRPGEYITFLTEAGRQALHASLAARSADGQALSTESPLIAAPDGSPARGVSIARVIRLSSSLIGAASDANLELCMTTGSFFRDWGMPGARFTGAEQFNVEDFA